MFSLQQMEKARLREVLAASHSDVARRLTPNTTNSHFSKSSHKMITPFLQICF